MFLKYIGSLDQVTVRSVEFKRGEVVDLCGNPSLAQKMIAWPDVEEAEPVKKTKTTLKVKPNG